ncbi:hypothetical protein PoB_005768500 [Plakobranchus ocellatus]|uniref:Secreted protein n=1 Tax=Plakobranchus ocellatus TaxID=259542 RepID=A0AAV4CEG0_9GAST|nr:hypothetical protein PoB_005768500 [Plakobranchus ocellatus]
MRRHNSTSTSSTSVAPVLRPAALAHKCCCPWRPENNNGPGRRESPRRPDYNPVSARTQKPRTGPVPGRSTRLAPFFPAINFCRLLSPQLLSGPRRF